MNYFNYLDLVDLTLADQQQPETYQHELPEVQEAQEADISPHECAFFILYGRSN